MDEQPLFHECKFVVGHTLQTNPQKREVTELVTAGGGQALPLKDIAQADYYIAAKSKPPPRNLPPGVSVVTQDEFFDAISNYTPLPKPVPKDDKKEENAQEQEEEKNDDETEPENQEEKKGEGLQEEKSEDILAEIL